MGKRLDAMLGRKSKTLKLKPIVSLAISRLAVMKTQRKSKCSHATSDVVQLLQLSHHDRALLRVEQVIKEQNMLDVLVMMEGFLNLLIERIHLIEQERTCPDELNEVVSSLLFGASRIGDFPELQEIRSILTSHYGKELAARCVELRNHCGVNHKMIQKLSTRMPDLENRMKVLKEIAADENIVLKLEEASSVVTDEIVNLNMKPDVTTGSGSGSHNNHEEFGKDNKLSDPVIVGGRKYKDVADAAQAAFESAASAAEAARAAVELSRFGPHDPDDHDTGNRKLSNVHDPPNKLGFSSGNDTQRSSKHYMGKVGEYKRSNSSSSTESAVDNILVPVMSFNEEDPVKLLEKDTVFYDSDDEMKTTTTTKVRHDQNVAKKRWI